MDFGEVMKYWPLLLVILNLLGMWIMWSVRKGVATKEDLKGHEEKTREALKTLDQRMLTAENNLRHMPSEAAMSKITNRLTKVETSISNLNNMENRIDQVSNQLSELIGAFNGMRRTLDMLHEFLLDGGRDK